MFFVFGERGTRFYDIEQLFYIFISFVSLGLNQSFGERRNTFFVYPVVYT